MSVDVRGTEGYAEAAPMLRRRTLSFADVHRLVLHLLPTSPCRVLDIGSGPGHDAAAFAAMGHEVVAVEPTDQLRVAAMAMHRSPSIEWVDDALPDLPSLAQSHAFELVMATAVWMHLDLGERRRAMPRLAASTKRGGLLIMSLRHGPVPAGRRMFEVSADETITLASAQRMSPILNLTAASVQEANRRAGVTWTWLAFGKN
jgi:protein-L-isoaspartate O-methyltransferase